jgi:hypothetical protein
VASLLYPNMRLEKIADFEGAIIILRLLIA